MRQEFGGEWTQKKLQALEKYLKAYMTIMRGNPKAQNFKVTYLDGFAGSGVRYASSSGASEPEASLFEEDFGEAAVQDFYNGSPRIALDIEKKFDHYIFVEKKPAWSAKLQQLKHEYPDLDIQVVQGDCNEFIHEWCNSLQWNDRALVFLDPYGMQVEWTTLEALARTEKADVWLLVPLGSAIMRLLVRKQTPPENWRKSLDRLFGSDEWLPQFYQVSEVPTLFGDEEETIRTANFETVARFFVQRLRGIFAGVLDRPAVLRNSKNIPLYVLCFAASNPKGAPTAVKIARDIAEDLNGSQ